ncbi:MAG: hypothetical protein KKH85_03245, partial [Proteobacteria bacterium]|nr:hypothetical protein [Pseudomonadota bacterium]
MKNVGSARHEYFKRFDARNFMHGIGFKKRREKIYVIFFLLILKNAECVQDSGISLIFNRLSERLRNTRHWPWYLIGIVVVLSEIVTLIMNSINSLIWWGRIDSDLLLIGIIDAFVASVFVGPIAVFIVQHTFNLKDINRKLQEQMEERIRAEQERLILEERLQRAEKMESLGLLAGGVAHDLNNVLGIVVGYAELLLFKANESSAIRPQLEEIMKGGQKAAAIVEDLLTLARRGVSGRNIINLNKIIADNQKSPEFTDLFFHHSDVKIKTDLDPELLNISGSTVHLGKTIFNLVSNASEAMPKGGVPTIKTANQYLDKPIQGYDEIREGDYVVLS